MPLLLVVMFFCACVLDHNPRLRVMATCVEQAGKRLFGIPDFKYYALTDGLHALFVRHPGKPHPEPRAPDNPPTRTSAHMKPQNASKLRIFWEGPSE